jgi:hypothetical protein
MASLQPFGNTLPIYNLLPYPDVNKTLRRERPDVKQCGI